MARTMLYKNNLPKYFGEKQLTLYVMLLIGFQLDQCFQKFLMNFIKVENQMSHLRSFGCKCFVLNNGKRLFGKMDAKSDEAIFMGYALNSKAYRVFNKTSLIVEESIHIVFYETNAAPRKGVMVDDDVDIENLRMEDLKEKEQEDSKEDPPLEDLQSKENQHEDLPKASKFVRDHPIDQVIGDPIQGVRTSTK